MTHSYVPKETPVYLSTVNKVLFVAQMAHIMNPQQVPVKKEKVHPISFFNQNNKVPYKHHQRVARPLHHPCGKIK